MSKKRDIEQEILTGIREIKNGKGKRFSIDTSDDIKDIRSGLNLSQLAFASLLGISIKTLQDWEQGRRTPQGPAKSLLHIAAKHPEVFSSINLPGH